MADAKRSDMQASDPTSKPLPNQMQPSEAISPEVYPPQSHHQPVTSRVLHLHHDGSPFSKSKTVYDVDEKIPLYAIDLHRFEKPQIVIRSAATSKTIGEVTFTMLPRKVTIAMQGVSFELKSRGMFKSGYTYTSPAAQSKMLTWEKESLGSADLVCTDDKGLAVARLDVSMFSRSKRAKLELVGATDGPLMEELLVTAFAYSELRRRRRNSSSGGAGGAAGV
ncbi:uncharacterized protein KY384_006470 [Bacidia gigantensis]|uniref:uncharacterized protein n=1 Tax=Bacidia gigantensis TaxID=2732470 RepID=UPI001D0374CA|nr:uncharacterized protein KY384_006470 [Bacidia gigantensis]KAG8528782.1 hypothetical protein KY384_006470 [Bacidia gigantensis]